MKIDFKNYIGEKAKNYNGQLFRIWLIQNFEKEIQEASELCWVLLNDLNYEGGEEYIIMMYEKASDLYHELKSINTEEKYENELIEENLRENFVHDWLLELEKWRHCKVD